MLIQNQAGYLSATPVAPGLKKLEGSEGFWSKRIKRAPAESAHDRRTNLLDKPYDYLIITFQL